MDTYNNIGDNSIKKNHTFSLAHLSLLDIPVLDLMQVAERAGYDYVSPRLATQLLSEPLDKVVGDTQKIKAIQHFLASSPLQVLDVEVLKIASDTDVVDAFEPLLDTAKAWNARHAITQIHTEDGRIPYEKAANLCALAQSYDINIVFETLPWSALSSVDKTLDLLRVLPCTNTGILLDLLHVYRTHTPIAVLSKIPQEYRRFVHVCDAKGPWAMDETRQKHIARNGRYPPGRGDIPVMQYLDAVASTTYSLEIPNDRLRRQMGDMQYAKFLLQDTKHYLSLSSCWAVKDTFYSVPQRLI